MVERDPNDEKNVIVEIQGGAGGEEAGLWAGRPLPDADPLRRAPRLRRPSRWTSARASTRSRSRARAPTRCSSSRAAPTACSACPRPSPRAGSTPPRRPSPCCPRPRTWTSQIDPNDLQIDVYRSSGPGGQSVNTTDSAVRITHKPSGIVVSMQDEKSQLQNREKALRVLRARLYERALAEQQAELAADRRSQVGTGDRAEKIRTYNYGERRVTDHRIKLTVHNLDQVLEGELDELTAALQADEKRRRLEAAGGGVSGPRRGVRAPAARRDALDGARHRDRGGGLRDAAPGRRSAARGRARGRRASACCSDPADRRGAGRARLPGRRAPPRGRARAGRLHRRPPRLSPPRAGGRPARADPAPGDRAAGRSARSRCRAGARVLDLGTGSGAVALALKRRAPRPRASTAATSARARSRSRARTPRASAWTVRWLHADLLDGLPDRFDAVLANPPYVAEGERAASRPRSCATSPPAPFSPAPDGLPRSARWRPSWRARTRRALRRPGGRRRAGTPRSPSCCARRLRRRRSERDLAGIERVVVGGDGRAHERRPLTRRGCPATAGVRRRRGRRRVPRRHRLRRSAATPTNEAAARRLYELKGRPAARSCAVMFFALDARPEQLDDLPEPRARWRWKRCCPGR